MENIIDIINMIENRILDMELMLKTTATKIIELHSAGEMLEEQIKEEKQLLENIQKSDNQIKSKLKEVIIELEKSIDCNCDFDKQEPESGTGHTIECRIHKEAERILQNRIKNGCA